MSDISKSSGQGFLRCHSKIKSNTTQLNCKNGSILCNNKCLVLECMDKPIIIYSILKLEIDVKTTKE